MLNWFLPSGHILESPRRKGTSPEQLPQSYWHVRLFVGHFKKSLIDIGKPSPLWAVTSLGRQTWDVSKSWLNTSGPVISIPSWLLAEVPALSSFSGFPH